MFGNKMSDGYYVGEVGLIVTTSCIVTLKYIIQLNGKRGLVPANFIIETSMVT